MSSYDVSVKSTRIVRPPWLILQSYVLPDRPALARAYASALFARSCSLARSTARRRHRIAPSSRRRPSPSRCSRCQTSPSRSAHAPAAPTTLAGAPSPGYAAGSNGALGRSIAADRTSVSTVARVSRSCLPSCETCRCSSSSSTAPRSIFERFSAACRPTSSRWAPLEMTVAREYFGPPFDSCHLRCGMDR